jgi:hypothetical protein
MTTRLMGEGLRSPEAAERLGIRGRDAYMMLFEGELDGGPGMDGMVYFDEASIDAYLDRHGFGVVAEASTRFSTVREDTDRHPEVQNGTSDSRNSSSEVLPDTARDGPAPRQSDS